MPVREKNCILLNVPTASEETVVCALFSSYLESHKNYVIVSVRVYMRVCASMCVRERGREGRKAREGGKTEQEEKVILDTISVEASGIPAGRILNLDGA